MVVWLEWVGRLVVGNGLAASAFTALIAAAMLGCRQPGRRRWLGRLAILGLPILPFLVRRGPAIVPPATSAIVAVVYAAGLAIGAARLAIGWWGTGQLVRLSEPPPAEAEELYRSLPYRGRGRRPRLRVARRLRWPALVGVARPTLLIPASIRLDYAADRDKLRLGLLHELAHAEAGDAWQGLAEGLAGVVFFGVPPLWWIGSRLRLDREFLADSRAAGRFGDPGAYAKSLLEWAVAADEPASGLAQGRPGSSLPRRFAMILQCPFAVEDRPPAWWRVAATVGLVPALLACSTLALRPVLAPEWDLHLAQGARPTRPGRATRLPVSVPPGPVGLSFAIQADATSLAEIRVLGHRLGPIAHSGPDDWHRVRVDRDETGKVVAQVDGSPVTASPAELPLDSDRDIIQSPADRTIDIRDFDLGL